jgi:ATP-binding cassette subfamily B protein
VSPSQTLDTYVIKKNSWPKFGRIGLLVESIRGRRVLYAFAIACLALEAFFTFAGPVIVQITIDSVIGTKQPLVPFTLRGAAEWLLGPNLSGGGLLVPNVAAAAPDGAWALREWIRGNVWAIALAFLACVLLQSAFSFLAGYCSNSVAEYSAKNVRDRLYSHVQDLPYETLLRAQSGDWLQRCTSDVDTARRFLCYEMTEMCRTVFLISFALPVMFSLCAGLAFWGCLVMPLVFAFSLGFHKIVGRIFLGADEREGVLSGIIQENVTGVRVVRAFARQDHELGRFGAANDRFRDQIFKLIAALAAFWGTSTFICLAQIGIVLGAGLAFLAKGEITLGLLVLFLTYEQQTLWPVRQFGRVLADVGKTIVALGRMAELLALPAEPELDAGTEPEGAIDGKWARGDIEFDNVSFAYPDGTFVLKNVSFTMKGGERLAIVGPTGSGKSTLVHLLLRFYEPTSGSIRIGGRDISTIPKRTLRETVALVLQEGFLYGKTIRENIRMGNKNAGEEKLVAAARQASLHGVVEGFTGGYETMVGERGVTLSGGQRQRLSLARAFVRESPILVLDDSLSAVDTETDKRIRDAIAESGSRASMILIAHRLTTLASADRILVLEGGAITAIGTHAELTEQPGLYRRLAELQRAIQ